MDPLCRTEPKTITNCAVDNLEIAVPSDSNYILLRCLFHGVPLVVVSGEERKGKTRNRKSGGREDLELLATKDKALVRSTVLGPDIDVLFCLGPKYNSTSNPDRNRQAPKTRLCSQIQKASHNAENINQWNLLMHMSTFKGNEE